jgi:hypothetical protein
MHTHGIPWRMGYQRMGRRAPRRGSRLRCTRRRPTNARAPSTTSARGACAVAHPHCGLPALFGRPLTSVPAALGLTAADAATVRAAGSRCVSVLAHRAAAGQSGSQPRLSTKALTPERGRQVHCITSAVIGSACRHARPYRAEYRRCCVEEAPRRQHVACRPSTCATRATACVRADSAAPAWSISSESRFEETRVLAVQSCARRCGLSDRRFPAARDGSTCTMH